MSETPPIDDYAWARRAEIEHWLAAPPDWGTRVMSRPGQVAAKAAQRLVPVEVLRASLRALDRNTSTGTCLLYTSPSPRDKRQSRMPSSA